MRNLILGFVAGVVVSIVGLYLWMQYVPGGAAVRARISPEEPPVCYSCFWQQQPEQLRTATVEWYRQLEPQDPLVAADAGYVLWRATSAPNCEARQHYRRALSGATGERRLALLGALGFSGPECGEDSSPDLTAASRTAQGLKWHAQVETLRNAAQGDKPKVEVRPLALPPLTVPAGATTLVIGESRVEIAPGTRVGTQVDRVARDWLSFQMRWDMSGSPLPHDQILDYHEGAFARAILELTDARVYPLGGTVVAREGDRWYAPDENGVFRFEVLGDKMTYPTTHTHGDYGWLRDTHGVSSIAALAMQRDMNVVLACGDSEGKMQAALHLAQQGIHVIFPGDRYVDEVLGYQAPGVLLGGAPLRQQGDAAVAGGQPVRISLQEPIVVEDTRQLAPLQYYDAPARYFRKLAQSAPLQLHFVEVTGQDQLGSVLQAARQRNAQVVAVRVATPLEDFMLRQWLQESPQRRAILFHSGLYPYAQPLFREFPQQVTFGDPKPRFE